MQDETEGSAPPMASGASGFERPRRAGEKARLKRQLSATFEAAIDAARKNGAHAVEIKVTPDETYVKIPLVPDAALANNPLDERKAKRAR